ncbi:UNVERIFIED_CONTAM: Pentatricopeptide repeat-containing protein [Sesamum calycinum]|uniref:Pentatricopeptide repeat-containing protein n=1 Tax=Sesamum calycinum TaxID=2727403 RepID=A0AAW2PN92_9LAMI
MLIQFSSCASVKIDLSSDKAYAVLCAKRNGIWTQILNCIITTATKRLVKQRTAWNDLKREEVLLYLHTFGDLIRAFLDSGLPDEALRLYDEMRSSPEPPLSLPFRFIWKGLIPHSELREKATDDFLKLSPHMIVYDPPDDLLNDDQEWRTWSEED